MTVLEAKSISVEYVTNRDHYKALTDINVTIGPGEIVGLIGPSGSGKSTLLKTLCGILVPSRGQVKLDSVPIAGINSKIGIIFQDNTLYSWMSARENIAFSLAQRSDVSKADRRSASDMFLDRVGLRHRADAYPEEMSGGMRQRVTLARALAASPRVLLLDEPFNALDTFSKAELHALLAAIVAEKDLTAVVATHDLDEAVFLADRILLISHGRIVFERVIDVKRPRLKNGARTDVLGALRDELFRELETTWEEGDSER